jgi:hypothetical protein
MAAGGMTCELTGSVDIEKQQPISIAEMEADMGSRLKPKSRRLLSIRTLLLHSRGLFHI